MTLLPEASTFSFSLQRIQMSKMWLGDRDNRGLKVIGKIWSLWRWCVRCVSSNYLQGKGVCRGQTHRLPERREGRWGSGITALHRIRAENSRYDSDLKEQRLDFKQITEALLEIVQPLEVHHISFLFQPKCQSDWKQMQIDFCVYRPDEGESWGKHRLCTSQTTR